MRKQIPSSHFPHFPASRFLLFVFLSGTFLATFSTRAQQGNLRTFINIQGVEITARLKAVAQGKVTVALPNGRDYTAAIASFSDADQLYIKQWGAGHPESFIPAPVKSGIKLDTINEMIGHKLFIDGDLWGNPVSLVAKHLRWPGESQTPHSSSYRGYPGENYRFIQARPYSVVLYGNDGKVSSVSVVFANKGDYFSSAGSGEKHFVKGKPVPNGATGLKMVMDRDAKAIAETLSKVLGQPKRQNIGDGNTRQIVYRWDWSGHAFLLANIKEEYVSLSIQSVEFADKYGKSKRTPDAIIRKRALENIETRANGDVVIRNIPMVDQGPKSFCVPATAERCMRYMGIPADMYLLAMAGQTTNGRGTSVAVLLEAVERDIKRKGRSFKIWNGELSIRKLAQYIDDGIPVMWGLFSTREFNQIADFRTMERSKPNAWDDYKEKTKRASAKSKLLKDHNTSHLVIITGYNKDTGEIAFSDSWGNLYKERWITVTEAQQISQDIFYVVDL